MTRGFDAERILIIDHEVSISRLYRMQLSYINMEFDRVTLGREGLAKLSSRHNAVIIEMTLPDVDGLTVATTIRERFDYMANIPIIAVSRVPIKGITRACEQARINALLKKPLAGEELRDALIRYVKKIPAAA